MPLLQDDQKEASNEDAYEFAEGQNSVCKMMNLVSSQSHDVWYTMLVKLKSILIKGGDARMAYTLPTLFF